MVKSTERSKPFEQQPIHWFRNTEIQEIIAAYTKLRNRSLADLVVIYMRSSVLNYMNWNVNKR